ncbi:MAG: 3-dehydroquinate synthase [Kiritimatiellae bacterium]|nr:3-dehydroquinate synthase [Kiritimatiellia bacterium]
MPNTPIRQTFSYQQQFTVPFEYPVHFTTDLFNPANTLLTDTIDRLHEHRKHRVVVLIDEGLANAQPHLPDRIDAYLQAFPQQIEIVHQPFLVPGGEPVKKDRSALDQVLNILGDTHYRLCRQSFVLAVGGGSFLDLVGLAAALVHRGLRLVRIPSTVLAQNDSAVGVKNGIDRNDQKNFLGTFAPPFAVLCDADLLATLPDKYWRGGIAEAFKVAIIRDADFFDFLCENARALKQRDTQLMESLIQRCAALHLDHIRLGGDPFETGVARPLDFGHWAAHRIEILSDQTFGHGLAVAVGLAIDTCCAADLGLLTSSERDRILQALHEAGLPLYTPLLDERNAQGDLRILQGLADFREHLGGNLTLTMPHGIGHQTDIHEMPTTQVEAAIGLLRRFAE